MLVLIHIALQLGFVVRALLRPHRDPTSRVAWIVVILALPIVGILGYVLLGETNIGPARLRRMNAALSAVRGIGNPTGFERLTAPYETSERSFPLFKVGQSISGFAPVAGNQARLMESSNMTIDVMVDDIDAATGHVHVLFYIWMPDANGTKIARALMRAAARGVTCRAMVDDLGSRMLVKSRLWADMESAGVKLGRALKIAKLPLKAVFQRIDLRNHRKIVVIDNKITYCGSQNCADPEFLTKAKYAPWVDAVMRFTGPVARQNQCLFVTDWMAYTDENVAELLLEPLELLEDGFPAQVVATGPTYRYSATPEMFEALIYSAQSELVVTTPYYVPNESLQAALCAAAHRGVKTTIILPARNDDFAVAATSRSYYAELIASGVELYEYAPGLLHTKSITVDAEVTLIGSANMDRRSFDLNYESNILLRDVTTSLRMRERQYSYLEESRRITAEEVAAWSWGRRLWNNALSIVGPLI